MRPTALVVSCEHASNHVPSEYATLFQDQALLESHHGWDPGALTVAKAVSESLGVPLVTGEVTRLLVDLNRSVRHPRLFSETSSKLSTTEKQQLLDRYYYPYRSRVEQWIRESIKEGNATLHVSIHSFTPALDGVTRNADLGFLYDPARMSEVERILAWRNLLGGIRPDLRVRRNYPYRGTADGLTTFFRRRFDGDRYAGIEIEINQALVENLPVEEVLHCLQSR